MSQPPFLIYLVDDDEDDLLFIHSAFQELGLEYVCKGFLQAEDLLQHLKFTAASGERPDVIVLDYEMPRMDGKGLLIAIRNTPALQAVPVLFYSDKISEVLEQELIALGALCCIKKGVTAAEQLKFARSITSFLKK